MRPREQTASQMLTRFSKLAPFFTFSPGPTSELILTLHNKVRDHPMVDPASRAEGRDLGGMRPGFTLSGRFRVRFRRSSAKIPKIPRSRRVFTEARDEGHRPDLRRCALADLRWKAEEMTDDRMADDRGVT